MPFAPLLYALDERHECFPLDVDDGKAEQFVSPANRTRERKNHLAAVGGIFIRRRFHPIVRPRRLTEKPPAEIFRQSVGTRHIVRRNDLPSVGGKQIEGGFPRMTSEDRIETAVDLLHILPRPAQEGDGLATHEQRIHQAFVIAHERIDLARDALHLRASALRLHILIYLARRVEDHRRGKKERQESAEHQIDEQLFPVTEPGRFYNTHSSILLHTGNEYEKNRIQCLNIQNKDKLG